MESTRRQVKLINKHLLTIKKKGKKTMALKVKAVERKIKFSKEAEGDICRYTTIKCAHFFVLTL